MRAAALIGAVALVGASLVGAQNPSTRANGTALPTDWCDPGALFSLRATDGGNVIGLYFCSAYNPPVWNRLAFTTEAVSVGLVPSGAILFTAGAACPVGYAEVAGLNGKTIIGTLAANLNVGTTGGSDSVTPTFTGSSATSSAVSGGTPAGTNSATATTGNCAATNLAIGTGAATACKATAPNLTVPAETFTGSALATHQHTVTATGTISAVDTRSAFVRWIACQKN
jgi:hypothetical protein